MPRVVNAILAFILIFITISYAAPAESVAQITPNIAFSIGEKLTFRIRYGAIVAGKANMAVKDTIQYEGKSCLHIETVAKSNNFFSKIFKVRDTVTTYVDSAGLFSRYFEQHLREGHYKADRWAKYDQHNHIVYTHKKDTLAAPKNVMDILASFYYVRTQKMAPGDTLFLANHSGKHIYTLAIIAHRRETIEVKAGKFNCLVVEPLLVEEGGIFKHDGRMLIWLSDDSVKMPVQMKSKVSFIGSITTELIKYKGVAEKRLAKW
ncbi:DUF3108 domain-containing protein [bacterium]|nr:DUF3108 domain-containing protein [bacterium]